MSDQCFAGPGCYADDWLAMMCSCEAYHVANEALAASEPKITKPT